MNLIIKAAQYAAKAHADSPPRKFNNLPYIIHPTRVAGRVIQATGVTEEVVAAAWLHDVVEDCADFSDLLLAGFPDSVFRLVMEVTNPEYVPTNPYRATRAVRIAQNREHIRKGSYWAKYIKLCDRIDNLNDLVGADRGYQRLYANESLLLADALVMPDYEPTQLNTELCKLAEAML